MDRELDRAARCTPFIDCFEGGGPGRAQRRLLCGHPGPHHHRELRGAGRAGPRHPRIAEPAGADRGDDRADRRRPPGAARGRPHQRAGGGGDHGRGRRTHRLSDAEIYSFAFLLLAAGSGTTWKQMGITLAALLQRPEVLDAVRADRGLLRSAIEESVRWQPTDPMFSRWVTEDIELLRRPLCRRDRCSTSASVRPTAIPRVGSDPTSTTSSARPADPGLRQRASRLHRAARGPSRDDGRHQRPAGPAPQPPAGPRRRAAALHRLLRAGATAIPVRFG